MAKEQFKTVETMELFGTIYEVLFKRNGYIKFKDTDIFIKGGIVYTLRGQVPLAFAQTDKPRIQKVRVVQDEKVTEEQTSTMELLNMFTEG